MRSNVRRRACSGLGALAAVMLCMTVGLVPQAHAQTGTISGRVLTDGGQPLPAAQVSIAALNIGVLGQQNGNFTIQNVPVGTHQLTAQRLGYRSATQDVTVTAGGTTTLNFTLSEEALQLDALVVTGTPGGTQRRAIGNVVTQVEAAVVAETMPISTMGEMLGARAPGLQFQEITGNVGAGSPIRIRGVGSVELGADPLIFIDGIRASNRADAGPEMGGGAAATALDDINPNDVESIEIIKGPAAATLYGTEASAGVIQIITKRGAQGAPQFDFAVHQGARFMRDPQSQLGTFYGCTSTPNPPCPLDDIFTYNPYDEANIYVRQIHDEGTSGLYSGGPTEWNAWPCEELFCYGHLQTYSLSVRGGTDAVRYFISGEFLGDNGVLPWNTNERTNVRANVSLLLAENLTFDVSTGYTDGDTRFATPVTGQGDVWDDMQWGNGYCLQRVNPGACPRLGGFQEHLPSDIWAQEATRQWNRFVGSFTAQHVFRDFLTQRLIFGIDKGWEINTNYYPLDTMLPQYQFGRLGEVRDERPIDSNLTLDYGASAILRLNDSWGFTTSVGAQYYERLVETTTTTARGFALPIQRTTNAGQTPQATIGYDYEQNKSFGAYVQEELNWNSRVFVTAAVRADDNSSFGGNFDILLYPKLSATWVISEELFWDVPVVNTLRLRSAMGQAGRQPNTFDGRTIWRSYTGVTGRGAVIPDSPGNPDIGPEVSTEIEVGFDIALLDDRVSGEFTYFTKKTEDALLDQSLSPSLGRPGDVRKNLGRVDNWGWEASVNAQLVTRPNWALDLTLAADHVDNEIKDLGTFLPTTSIRVGFPTPNSTTNFRVVGWSDELDEFGVPLEMYCDSGTGPEGNRRFPGGEPVPCEDMAGQPLLNGPTYYTHTFTVQPNVTLFDNLRIFATAQGQYGKIGSESQVHWGLRYNNGYCTQALTNDPACVEWIVRNIDGEFYDNRISTAFKADFWKLREVGVQYELPQALVERTGASRASFGIAGRELATLWRAQKYLGGTAAGAPGRRIPDSEFQDLYRLPGIATVTASLRVTF